MKGERCIKTKTSLLKTFLLCLFVFFFSLFSALLLGFSRNASAIEIDGGYNVGLTVDGSWATVPMAPGGVVVPQRHGNGLYFFIPANTYIEHFGIGLAQPLDNQPHLISFTMTYIFGSVGTNMNYTSPPWSNMVTVYDNCVGGMDSSGNFARSNFSCNIVLLANGSKSQITTIPGTDWFSAPGQTNIELQISPISVITLKNGISQSDIQSLSNNITQAIEDLEISVEGSAGATPEQIQDAIDEAIVNIVEQDQEQADEIQADIEDNQDIASVESQTTNLLNIIIGFVNAISSPVGSTCILPIDLRNYRGAALYDVDLCHLSPPAGITNVLNVAFLFFVLALAVSAVRMIIQLYNEVTRN